MDSLLPFTTFAIAAAITPGPNDFVLAASGVAFGWRRTLPHLLGIPLGFSALLVISGFGVGTLIATVPAAAMTLRLLGSAYLLYLAWLMRGAFLQTSGARAGSRPIRFHESALFQFANPKGWIMALSAVALFVPDAANPWVAVALLAAGFALVTLPCAGLWLTLGVAADRLLRGDTQRRVLGAAMGALMLYTVVSIWFL